MPNKLIKNKSTLISQALTRSALFLMAYLAMIGAIELFFPDRPNQMSFDIAPLMLWIFVGILSIQIKRRLNMIYILVMYSIYLVGNLNNAASFYRHGAHYSTDLQTTNLIYTAFGLALVIGLLIGEYILPTRQTISHTELRKEGWNTVFLVGCFLFPLIWFADELYTLRRIPILTGESILDEMYSTNYGRLYGYGVLLAVSALLMWSKQLTAKSNAARMSLAFLLASSTFIMVFDGRRVFALVFLCALLAFEVTRDTGKGMWRRVSVLVVTLIGLYLLVLYFRQGGMFGHSSSPALTFSQVGVEYRDFAFLVTRLNPGDLIGYHWFGSAIGGFSNWFILGIFGIEKNALVFGGSAYQIALEFRSAFGIRIGLVPEIWLEYGLYGTTIVTLVGIFFAWISRLVEESKSEIGRIFSCVMYGVVILSFVGQTTAITGYMSLLLYLWLVWQFLELFRTKDTNESASVLSIRAIK